MGPLKHCDCGSGCSTHLFFPGLALGLTTGLLVGASLSPSRREMKKMARKTANHVADAIDHLKDTVSHFTT